MDIQRSAISLWLSNSILLLSTGLVAHVMAIPIILDVAGKDAWISILISAPIYTIWLLFIRKVLFVLEDKSFIQWMEENWGKFIAYLIKIVLACLLLFNATYTLLDTVVWTITTYLKETPFLVIAFCALVLCLVMAYNGLQSIAIVSSILLPLVVFLGYFVAISNTKHKDFTLLLPMFDLGILPSIRGTLYVLASLADLWIILLLAHRIKTKPAKLHAVFLALFLLMMVLGPTTGALTEFGATEAMRQRHTAFDQWKILSIGKFFQHVDFLSIYQWLSGAIIRISISLFLFSELFNIKENRSRILLLTTIGVVIFGAISIYWRDDLMLEMLKHIYFPFLLSFITLLSLMIGATLLVLRWKEKSTYDE